jgi:hypothetical protein
MPLLWGKYQKPSTLTDWLVPCGQIAWKQAGGQTKFRKIQVDFGRIQEI